ncbi:MAG: hypothetical protein WDO19_28410 [Bacteroidota bacterium]
MTLQQLNKESIEQYQAEEKSSMAFRVAASRFRLMDLFNIMAKDNIALPEKTEQLKNELNSFLQTKSFNRCHSMGQILKLHLKMMLKENLKLIQEKTRRLKNR